MALQLPRQPLTFCRQSAFMTTANKITLVRILMIPAFVTMAIYYGQSIERGAPLEWQRLVAILIFLVASISDGLDGYVARRYNQRSSLGVILDPIADKGLLLSGIITLSISNWSKVDPEYGRFPAWFPVLVISRDAVILVGTAVLYFLVGHVTVKPNDRDRMGDVAAAMVAFDLGCRRRGFIHPDLRHCLCTRRRAPASGRRPRQRPLIRRRADEHRPQRRDYWPTECWKIGAL